MKAQLIADRFNFSTAEELEAWDSLLEKAGGFCLYHSAWLRGIDGALAAKPMAYLLHRGGEPVALVAGQGFGRDLFRGLRRTYATPYCFPLPVSDEHLTLEEATQALKRFHRVIEWTIPCRGSQYYSCSSQERITNKSTMILPIDDLEAVWKGFKGELRTNIRKATNCGVVVRRGSNSSNLFRLYQGLCQSNGWKIPFSREGLDQLLYEVQTSGIGELFEASGDDGEVHCAALILYDRCAVYYILSASHPKLRLSGANSLMLWEIFNCYSTPERVFDFVGCNIPSITRYKKNFRGNVVSTPQVTKYNTVYLKPLVSLHKLVT